MAIVAYRTVMPVLTELQEQYEINMNWAKSLLDRTGEVEMRDSLQAYYERNKEYFERYSRAIEILKHHGTT